MSEGCFQNQIKYDQDLVHTTGSIREYCHCSATTTAERLSEEDFEKLASGNVPRHFPGLMQESAASCSDLLIDMTQRALNGWPKEEIERVDEKEKLTTLM